MGVQVRQCLAEARPAKAYVQAPLTLSFPSCFRGKAAAPCCTCRLVAARLRSPEAKQRGFLLDGCGLEGVGVGQLMELLHAAPHELTNLSRMHRPNHNNPSSSCPTEVPTIPMEAEEPGPVAQQPNGEATAQPLQSPDSPNPNDRHDGGSDGSEGSVAASGDPPEAKQANPPLQLELSDVEKPRPVDAVEGAGPPESVERVSSIPPLQLGDLRPQSADVRGKYPLPVDSGSETASPGPLSSSSDPSYAAPALPKSGDVKAVEADEDEDETENVTTVLPFPRVDIVFVFDAEPDDLWTDGERLLQEEGANLSDQGTTKQRELSPTCRYLTD